MMNFENLNEGPMIMAVPAWQTAFIEKLANDEEIAEQVKAANKEFVELMTANLARAKDGYQGTAVRAAITATHTTCFKRVDDSHTAIINLLMRTVYFEEDKEQ